MSTYGVNTRNSGYADVSRTIRGAMNYATRHGHKEVYRRGNGSYNVFLVAEKKGKKWYRK